MNNQAEPTHLHEIHRRFVFGVLMGMDPDDLRPFVTGFDQHDHPIA